MLKAKYLNKKYFFNKNGPIDEENQNIVIISLKATFLKRFFLAKKNYSRFWKESVAGTKY